MPISWWIRPKVLFLSLFRRRRRQFDPVDMAYWIPFSNWGIDLRRQHPSWPRIRAFHNLRNHKRINQNGVKSRMINVDKATTIVNMVDSLRTSPGSL
jgi:hypothetical protein